jgi:predicted RecB family nuclease
MTPLSAAVYGGINTELLNKAAERGTEVHLAAESYANFGIEDISHERRGYFDGFRKWFDEAKPVVISTEFKTYHKYLIYAGTVDLLAYLNGKLYVIDYKTTSTIEKMLTRVQLEAYKQALISHGIPVEGKAILHLRPDGRAKLQEYELDDSKAWEVFGSLVNVNNFICMNRR